MKRFIIMFTSIAILMAAITTYMKTTNINGIENVSEEEQVSRNDNEVIVAEDVGKTSISTDVTEDKQGDKTALMDEKYKEKYGTRIVSDPNALITDIPRLEKINWELSAPGSDMSKCERYNCLPSVFGQSVIKHCNLSGIVMRERDDASRYMIYDINDECREFIFLGLGWQKAGKCVRVGYSVLYKNDLCYEDFSEITVGKTMSDVKEVDDVIAYYEDFYNYHCALPSFKEIYNEYPYCSIHYLRDGLLRIIYDFAESSDKVTITAIEYYPDYKLETCMGDLVDYKINPLDLPKY